MQTEITIRLQQFGQTLPAFKGCRFVSAGNPTGTVGSVDCFDSVNVGDPRDLRRGRTINPKCMRGPFTVELIDPAGNVVGRLGIGTVAQVAAHPNGAPELAA